MASCFMYALSLWLRTSIARAGFKRGQDCQRAAAAPAQVQRRRSVGARAGPSESGSFRDFFSGTFRVEKALEDRIESCGSLPNPSSDCILPLVFRTRSLGRGVADDRGLAPCPPRRKRRQGGAAVPVPPSASDAQEWPEKAGGQGKTGSR